MGAAISLRDEVYAALLAATVRLRAGTEAVLAAHDLTMLQYVVLRKIVNAVPGVSPSDIRNHFRLSKATASRLVRELCDSGFIDVWGCEWDHRRHTAVATTGGVERYLEATEALAGARALGSLPDPDVYLLYDVLTRLPTLPRYGIDPVPVAAYTEYRFKPSPKKTIEPQSADDEGESSPFAAELDADVEADAEAEADADEERGVAAADDAATIERSPITDGDAMVRGWWSPGRDA